ncbi:hypothetical protein [Niallia taxi]|uniref:hypothetical protein n=2 Tax=Niallia taxi TaxID=2499688 RepID=UPI0037437D08
MKNNFQLKIMNQYWLDKSSSDYDLCSHGEIYLQVNDTIITQSGEDEEWGVSESALALLRTLNKDYICNLNNLDNEEGLIFHGCGAILMMGCPISINWSVKHTNDQVLLSDFVKVTTTSSDEATHYPNLQIELNKEYYKQQILQFALQAKQLFETSPAKAFFDDYDKQMYIEFWEEYDQLLQKATLNK